MSMINTTENRNMYKKIVLSSDRQKRLIESLSGTKGQPPLETCPKVRTTS